MVHSLSLVLRKAVGGRWCCDINITAHEYEFYGVLSEGKNTGFDFILLVLLSNLFFITFRFNVYI